MMEGIETEQDDYELGRVAPYHEMHHEMCLKDRERFEGEIEQLQVVDSDHLRRIERLERTVNMLAAMINWDNVDIHHEGF